MSFDPQPELRGHTLVVTVWSHDGRPVLDRGAPSADARLLKGDTGVLCDRIDQEITLFQQALQVDTTLKRLQRIARLAA